MKPNNALQVLYDERLVGTLAMTADHKAAFQYSEEWLEHGFPISPFSLPLKRQVFVPNKDYFDGLFGVFADSLPDNWGRTYSFGAAGYRWKIRNGGAYLLSRKGNAGKTGP